MKASSVIFSVYLFFAVYCAGSMTVLQLQHFALYPKVGAAHFVEYIRANNRAAFVPSILPALLVFGATIGLLVARPGYVPRGLVVVSLVLNVVNMASSVVWQAKIHGQLETEGFHEGLIRQLITTNWIRTGALLVQALIALYCVVKELE